MKKRLLSLLLVAALFLLNLPISAASVVTGGVYGPYSYSVKDGEATITAYSGTVTTLTIPSYIGGYAVTAIGERAFESKGIRLLTLPSTLRTIGFSAFANNDYMHTITFGGNETYIGNSAFYRCVDLYSVYLPDSLETIDEWAFYGAQIVNLNLGEGVQTIGAFAFANDFDITEVVIPDSVSTIGMYAFQSCYALKDVTLGTGVTAISPDAFDKCASGLTIYGITGSYAEEFADLCRYRFTSICPGADDREHVYEGGTCTAPGICINCGEEAPTIAGHNYNGYTNSCTVCGVIDETVFSYTYTEDGAGVTIMDYTGQAGTVTIPATLNGYPVMGLSGDTFMDCTWVSAILVEEGHPSLSAVDGVLYSADGTTLICYPMAKEGRSFTVPATVTTIAYNAFRDCTQLRSVTLPAGLKTIGFYAFYHCDQLQSVTFPQGLTTIGYGAYEGCSALSAVVIPDSVTSLGEFAFYSSGADTVTIGDGVTAIPPYAFAYCTLSSVTMGDGIVSIGKQAFSWCPNLKTVNWGANVTTLDSYVFHGCSSLAKVTIPDSVTAMGYGCFEKCTSLKEITIGSGVPKLDEYSFKGCTALQAITIPGNVKTISLFAFDGCTALTDLTLCEGVEVLAWDAFGDTAITAVRFPASMTFINGGAFDGGALTTVYGYAGSVAESFAAEEGLTFVPLCGGGEGGDHTWQPATCTTPKTCTKCGTTEGEASGHAWTEATCLAPKTCSSCGTTEGEVSGHAYGNSNVCSVCGDIDAADFTYTTKNGKTTVTGYTGSATELTVPAILGDCPVKALDTNAFADNTGLTAIHLPDSLTTVGVSAFNGCTALQTVSFGSGLTTVGFKAFYNCSALTELTIPASVTMLSVDAFYGCTSLAKVDITDLTAWCGITFGDYESNPLFYGADLYVEGNLAESLIIPAEVQSISKYAFNGCSSLTEVVLPEGVTAVGYAAFFGCVNMQTVEMPLSLTALEGYAFHGCTALQAVVIPAGVTTIGNRAFFNCAALKTATIASGVTTISNYVFYGCTSLEKLTVPASVTAIGTDLLGGAEQATVYGYAGSYAQTYTTKNKIPFAALAAGDVSADGTVSTEDAIYLLYHTLLPQQYPLACSGDLDGNGTVDSQDAVCLLYHALLPEQYPLN